jgi:FkbM family methyltransferase
LNPLKVFSRPEYLFRPAQVIRRLARIGKRPAEVEAVKLPWGAPISVRTTENVGSEIYYYGVFDRIVPETIWRLLDPGEIAVDVGANVGQNTSLMALRSGGAGQVTAFEPHPDTFNELRQNVAKWNSDEFATIRLESVALAGKSGELLLRSGQYLSGAVLSDRGDGINVPVRCLDDFLADGEAIALCKIDVEGQELAVLQGAEKALQRRLIRDVLFEDFAAQPSAVAHCLQQHGFTIFALNSTWLAPRLVTLKDGSLARAGFTYNYLATLNPARARERFRSLGWKCLMSLS